MTIIELNGEIGWDIWPQSVGAQLKAAKGDDLTVRFSSVGGDVFEGGDIYNMLADYKNDNPGATMSLEIGAVAASMGSAISSSPVWDSISIVPTSVYMIHNPSSLAWGDYREMISRATFLEKLRDMYAGVYATKAETELSEIQTMMDDETWFFGQEIIDAGFADSMREAPKNTIGDKMVMVASMKAKFTEMKRRQSELSEGSSFDQERAAAVLRTPPAMAAEQKPKEEPIEPETPATIGGENNPAQAGDTEENKVMDKNELMKDSPQVYAESKADGVAEERERVAALAAMKKEDQYKELPEVLVVIDECIENGKTADQAQPLMVAAMMKIMKDPARMAVLESPGDLGGEGGENASTETRSRSVEV